MIESRDSSEDVHVAGGVACHRSYCQRYIKLKQKRNRARELTTRARTFLHVRGRRCGENTRLQNSLHLCAVRFAPGGCPHNAALTAAELEALVATAATLRLSAPRSQLETSRSQLETSRSQLEAPRRSASSLVAGAASGAAVGAASGAAVGAGEAEAGPPKSLEMRPRWPEIVRDVPPRSPQPSSVASRCAPASQSPIKHPSVVSAESKSSPRFRPTFWRLMRNRGVPSGGRRTSDANGCTCRIAHEAVW